MYALTALTTVIRSRPTLPPQKINKIRLILILAFFYKTGPQLGKLSLAAILPP